jgi:diguanylate cyclase (GGDEF)-like protein
MTRIDASEPVGEVIEPAGRRSLRLWNVVAVAVLLAGLALSVVGAVAWHGYVQDQAAQAFDSNAFSISAAVSTSLRRDIDFVATQRAGVVAVPDLNNRELAVWYKSVDIANRFPGGVGFAFVQRVLPFQLSAFGAQVVADPPVNEPVTSPYTVFPTGQRSEYCLQRFGIATSSAAKPIPATFDFCSSTIPPGSSPSPIPHLLDEATKSGHTTILAAGKIAKTGGIADLFVTFSPVYSSNETPRTVAARLAQLRGWIVATFSGDDLLRSNLQTQHRLLASVTFEQPGTGVVTIASSGTVPHGATFTRILRFNANGSWAVRVEGSAQSPGVIQGIGVGVLGGGLSALLFLLFMLLTRSRAIALRFVDKATRQLRHMALYDPLTELPNRALLLDRAEQMLIRAKRHPLLVGALFIDLDNFKEVNDTYGHHVGDQLLKAVGVRLSGALRASDSVGRLGGDEFVALVEGELGGVGPEVVAQQLVAAFGEPFVLEGINVGPLEIRASIGVALGARNGPADLLRDADVALYVAKARGKHGYVVFRSDMEMDLTDRLGSEGDPVEARSGRENRPQYQSRFDLNDVS